MKSIYIRNFAATAALVTMCFLIIVVSFVGIGRSYVIDGYLLNMSNNADAVARYASAAVSSGYDSLGSFSLSMYLSSTSVSTGNHIFITDADGVVMSCSDAFPTCEHIGVTLSPGVMAAVESGEEFDRMTTLGGMYPINRYVVASPVIGSSGEVLGHVFVSSVMDDILSSWDAFIGVAFLISAIVFVLTLIMSLAFSKRLARPLDEIAAASRKFARGDFSVRVKQVEDPTDEMGALIESFNKMADSLEVAESRRSEFIANISHELRPPMTTIAGFADGILDGTIPREAEEKYLISIRDETRRLSRLVRDMLDVSQMRNRASDPNRRTVFDLTELILQTMLSFESRATKKDLDVDPQLPDAHIMVRADRDGITQVIYNLIDNAVKFASAGSCITVALYKDVRKAYISVKNVGETIPPDDLPFIFDRFHKSDRSRSMDKDGVGLGLYLVKSIINAHDEDIAVKSENGVTEFVFTLALSE